MASILAEMQQGFAETKNALEGAKHEAEQFILRLDELEKSIFGQVQSTNGHISPDQFARFGARKAGHKHGAGEVLQVLLETLHIRSIRLDEAVEKLQMGGYHFAPRSPRRQLSLGARQNPALHYDKHDQTIWLRKEWEKERNER